jgi:hypothetical protein
MAVILNASTTTGFVQSADTSGVINLQSNGSTKLSVLSTGVSGTLVQGTAVASTSGTSIDFTGIPSWAKRITVMFSGVSTTGASLIQVQLGDSGGVETTGYSGYYAFITTSAVSGASSTTGFQFNSNTGLNNLAGNVVICNLSGNTWTASLMVGSPGAATSNTGGGTKTLSDTLDRIRITTVNGTDTFDAGSINILYEG